MNPDPKPPHDTPPRAAKPGDAVVGTGPIAGHEKRLEELTPEEQMERFAQDQKENDWGHQPC